MRRRALVLTAAVAAAAVMFGWSPAHRYWRAGKMLTALESAHVGKPAEAAQDPLVEENLTVNSAGEGGPFRARIFRRRDQPQGHGLIVVHGIHHEGMNEHRMVPFARELARAGLVVMTPEITDLADYRITRQGVSVIRDAAVYLGGRHDLVGDAPVGLLGFSFAGGLALVAAEQPPLAGHVAYVVSVGGHHDLERVLRFLIRNEVETPAGLVHKQAHDYGLMVVLYGHVDQFAPEPDRAPLRDALRASLNQDRPAALAAAARLTTERGRELWQLADTQKLQTLAPQLEAIVVEQRAELAALSPRGRLAAIHAPVYLVHGTSDSVIPPSETEWAGAELGQGNADHIALVSPLIEHVEVNRTAGFGDKLALLRFIAQLL
jgi:dienelactone hydrolase